MTPPRLDTVSTAILEGGIGMIKFNRPKNANALGARSMDDLLMALSWALDDDLVKVVILSGEGKFFSAGMDLVHVPEQWPVLSNEGIELLRYAGLSEDKPWYECVIYDIDDWKRQFHKLPISSAKVLIAAVNGPAVGYRTSSIALFDLVYSVPDAVFFTPYV